MLAPSQVLRVDDKPVNNLTELVAAVEEGGGPAPSTATGAGTKGGAKAGSSSKEQGKGEGEGGYIRFDLEYNQVLILDRAAALKATAEILAQHCIAHDRSEELRGGGGGGGGEAAAAAAPVGD